MIGNNELTINHDTLKLAIIGYLERIQFPQYDSVDYIDSKINGDAVEHEVFIQSHLFGGVFSIKCGNEFIQAACAHYVNSLIGDEVEVDDVKYGQYPQRYMISLIEPLND